MIKHEGMSRCDLYKHFADLGFKTGAEVGVWAGENARNLVQIIPDVKLYLVDPYKEYSHAQRVWKVLDKVRKTAHNRLRHDNVDFLEMFSEQAAAKVKDNSLDFVYIDGNHAYDFVMLDIIMWNPKVKKGGIISGHDYENSHRRVLGVKSAVDDYCRWHGIEFELTDGSVEHRKSGGLSSWFWVKEHWMYPY